MTTRYEKILFLCTGNTCRSPMAEAIYRSMDTSGERETFSRGMVVLFPEPANPKVEVVLGNHNLQLNKHTAKPLRAEDVDDNTLILTMTVLQKRNASEQFEGIKNIYTLKEFVGETGDVTDPYGGTLAEYEDCYIELARLIKKTVYKLNEED